MPKNPKKDPTPTPALIPTPAPAPAPTPVPATDTTPTPAPVVDTTPTFTPEMMEQIKDENNKFREEHKELRGKLTRTEAALKEEQAKIKDRDGQIEDLKQQLAAAEAKATAPTSQVGTDMKAYYEIIERLNDEERNALAKELDRILEHQKTARAVVDNRRNLDANHARALFGALQDTV